VTRHVHVIGIGAGDPGYVTIQAVEALNGVDVFFAMDKGETKDDLVALRREICQRFIREPGYRFVELADPQRAPTGDYRQRVADWHEARAAMWAQALVHELADDGVGAFLAWGDPSLYDSTLRILDMVAQHVEFTFDVIPGVTAIQALTARHRIPLNDVGEPVLVTTGRRLREHGLSGAAVVMLDGDSAVDPDLVGRLSRHARRDPRPRDGRRHRGADRGGPRRRKGAPRLDHGHLPAATVRQRPAGRGKIGA
jgi:precorrin-6A synthase